MVEYQRESRLTGRLSGRVAPRDHLRLPARELTFLAHDLYDAPGDADPRQGQLFAPEGYQRPLPDVARSQGVPVPRAHSGAGFLPGIESSANKTARQRKVESVQRWAATRAEHPMSSGDAPTVAGAMNMVRTNRMAAPESSSWYAGSPGVEGDSVGLLRNAAERTRSSVNDMTRAVAVTSPKAPWSAGNPNHRSYPNIGTAVNVHSHVRDTIARGERRTFSDPELADIAQGAPGQGLFKDKAARAFFTGGETTEPVVTGPGYEKTPNFNENMLMSRQDIPKVIRRGYSGAFTMDGHQWASEELPQEVTKRVGVYDMEHMINSRVAFKNRELPGTHQAAIWTRQRGPDPLTASMEEEGKHYYEPVHSLFTEDHGGSLHPSFDFTHRPHSPGPVDKRSDTAKRMGLEF